MKSRKLILDGNLFYISDTHLGHSNVIIHSNRPFLTTADQAAYAEFLANPDPEKPRFRVSAESTKQMDDTLIDNINRTVGENDILIHHGDFAVLRCKDRDYLPICREYRDRIRCKRIIYIFGNHDHQKLDQIFPEHYDLIPDARLNGQVATLCHYALYTWNKSHHGAIHLYGHSHSSAEASRNNKLGSHRSLDIGVDNAAKLLGEYRPFSHEEVMAFMAERTGHKVDHHGPGSDDG